MCYNKQLFLGIFSELPAKTHFLCLSSETLREYLLFRFSIVLPQYANYREVSGNYVYAYILVVFGCIKILFFLIDRGDSFEYDDISVL
jgi:hypothetical protein